MLTQKNSMRKFKCPKRNGVSLLVGVDIGYYLLVGVDIIKEILLSYSDCEINKKEIWLSTAAQAF